MVLLIVTPTAKAAVEHYRNLRASGHFSDDGDASLSLDQLDSLKTGNPMEHEDLIKLSTDLAQYSRKNGLDARDWRLDHLLKGASVYQPPPPTKAEPTPQYKALMQRLRHEEEQRQYERMINPPSPHETLNQARVFNPATSIGQGPDTNEIDDVTFADVNRQMALIINVLVSIIACSVAIWVVARRWSVPQRLGLSMSGSCLVAAAEVAIYMGYIRRIKDAKDKEQNVVESKEVMESWVLDATTGAQKTDGIDGMRYRKGKHRRK